MSIAHNHHLTPAPRTQMPSITTMGAQARHASRARVSKNTVRIAINLAVAMTFIALALEVRGAGSVDGAVNGADLLAAIFVGSAIMPLCRAWRRYRTAHASVSPRR